MQNRKTFGLVDVNPTEYVFNLYLPIKLQWGVCIHLPENIKWALPIVQSVIKDVGRTSIEGRWMYITVKYMWVGYELANRPGWHADGFLTNDLNYIWYDRLPTEFSIQDFEVDECHIKSLEQFEEQAKDENIQTYPIKHVLKLDSRNVHRVAYDDNPGFRTFVKVSISDHFYNLEGNAKNPAFEIDEEYYERFDIRNDPNKAQMDFK